MTKKPMLKELMPTDIMCIPEKLWHHDPNWVNQQHTFIKYEKKQKKTTTCELWLKPCNVEFRPKESYFAIVATISFHSFKELDSIMKCFGSRMKHKVVHWANPRFSPTTVASILNLADILQAAQMDLIQMEANIFALFIYISRCKSCTTV